MPAKRIVILGSTGSIGRQALEIIQGEPGLRACGLSAGANWKLLAQQAGMFKPDAVAIADPTDAGRLQTALPAGVKVFSGPDAMSELVCRLRPDLVVTAMVGSAGLAPTLTAIECKCDLAIANKESLVMAGGIVMPAARRAGVNILPVDSEHSAIFQCLAGRGVAEVRKIFLTASGGPLRTWPLAKVRNAKLAEVLNHPTWRMGQKVTIDSATMMNKALEVIEAHWLFDLPAEKIGVLIHPQSLVHGLVEFCDGSILAQVGAPSMTTPIACALHHPHRRDAPSAPLDLAAGGTWEFLPLDKQRYPAMALGYDVIQRGGTAGAVLNAANEVAVAAFVAGRLAFGAIVDIVREVLNRAEACAEVDVGKVLAADAQARAQATEIVERL
jgi:1-deoxy-D-xylulose-5-phosphate reductoisomerase